MNPYESPVKSKQLTTGLDLRRFFLNGAMTALVFWLCCELNLRLISDLLMPEKTPPYVLYLWLGRGLSLLVGFFIAILDVILKPWISYPKALAVVIAVVFLPSPFLAVASHIDSFAGGWMIPMLLCLTGITPIALSLWMHTIFRLPSQLSK